MDPVKICPKCGSPRIVTMTRATTRKRSDGRRDRTSIEYYACLACWYKWDAVGFDDGAVIPAGIEARRYG